MVQRKYARTIALAAGLAAALASAGHANAQTLQVGVVGGFTINSIVGDDSEGLDPRTTPTVGAQLVFQPATVWGIETGLRLVAKGATLEVEDINSAFKILYVEIPALLRLVIPIAGFPVRPVLAVGGSFGIKGDCEIEASLGSATESAECEDPRLQGAFDIESVDLGMSAGAGAEITVRDRFLIVPGIRYTRGFSDMSAFGDPTGTADAKNSSIEISLALRMKF
jgi:opacity protein-like surface antigen